MLQTEGLTYSYGDSEQLHFPDIECKSGEHWLLLGQSGSGKTTLLHLLGGLRSPQEGIVKIEDTIINKLSSAKLDRFRGQNIGIIFQQSHFVRSISVQENLALTQKLAGVRPDYQRIREILNQLNVGHKMKSSTRALSVGEQQRVAIARALINKPKIILADEPTSALDDKNTAQVIELLEEQARAVDAILLIVTHDNRLTNIFDKQIHL